MNLAALVTNFEAGQKRMEDHLMDIKVLLLVLDHDPTQPGTAPRTEKISSLLKYPPKNGHNAS